MTAPTCLRCGQPLADGALICRAEAQQLAQALTDAAGHAQDAQGGSPRQSGYAGGGRAAYGEAPMPDLRRAVQLDRIATAVDTTARMLVEDGYAKPRPVWRPAAGPLCPPTGYRCPHRSCEQIRDRTPPAELAQALTWLSAQTEALRKHPAARQAFRDLHDCATTLERLVDRPPSGHRLVGMCDCGRILYAPHGRDVVRCPKPCGAEWNVTESQDILLSHLDDKLVTVPDALDMAGWLDTDRTREQIRKLIAGWVKRGQLAAHGHIWRDPTDAEVRTDPEAYPVAVPTYRFGEIRNRLAETPRRNREGAAA